VWNINKRAIGVEINKVHREKQFVKRIHVRVEHVRPSKSATGHLDRVAKNEVLKAAAKKSGVPCAASELKREPKGPRGGFELEMGSTFEGKTHLLTPVPYVFKPISRSLNV